MTQTTKIKAGESAKTITLPEGFALIITGSTGALGAAYHLDPVLGGTNSLKSWSIGTGALAAPIGPFANSQKIHITCQVGTIEATVQDAVLTVTGGSVAAVLTGSGIVGEKVTATLPAGVVGTLQFTKTLKASPFTKSNIANAVANAVNSLQYTIVQGDLVYDIGCDASNTVSPSNKIPAVSAPSPEVPATALTLTGPTSAAAGAASSAYTVALSPTGGTVSSPVTVTPTAVSGVTFTPASLVLTTASPSGTFTANAATAGTKLIAVTNNSGLTNPAAISLVVAAGGIVALNSATVFGGSHAAYGQPYVSGAAPNGGGGTSLSDLAFMNDQLRKTGPGVDLINLRAEGGTTVFQQRAAQLPSVLTDPGEGAIYYSSANAYNDTTSASLNGGVPYTQAQIIAAEIDIMQQIAAAKKWAIWFNLTPVSQAGSTGAKARASEFPAHNAAMKTEADKHANILFVDAYSFFLDPASQELNPRVDYIQAADGIHKTTLGARLFAEYYTPIVASFIASFTKYRAKGSNMLKPWAGTGGTASAGTGTVTGIENLPAGYQLEVASGTTNVVITKPDANTVRVAMTNPAASTASTVQIVSTNGAEMVASMVSGDAIQGGFDFAQVGTATGLTRVATSLRINGSASGTSWRSMFRDTTFEPDASFKMDQRALSARRLWNPWRLPSTPTAVDFFIQWNLLAQGTATFDITATEVCRLT